MFGVNSLWGKSINVLRNHSPWSGRISEFSMHEITPWCWVEIISTKHLLSISTQHPDAKYCCHISLSGEYHDFISHLLKSTPPAVQISIIWLACVCMYVCMSQQTCISPAPGRSSKLTHTGVEIDTCAFQTGCQLSSAATGMSLELRFLARFQWREAYVLDNWQLAELPQSGGREFDPRRVHDNLSVPLWVYMRFPVPEHQN